MIKRESYKLLLKVFYIFFSPSIRMSRKDIIFNDEKINKSNFYRNKKPFIIDDIDVNKLLISKKKPYHKKKLT